MTIACCDGNIRKDAFSRNRTLAFYGQNGDFWYLPVILLGPLIKQVMRSTASGKICIKNKKCRTKSVGYNAL
jgi:hypothetical protein